MCQGSLSPFHIDGPTIDSDTFQYFNHLKRSLLDDSLVESMEMQEDKEIA